jgi:hypothetical protein
MLGEPLEMMDMKVFITFAFCVPQNRDLDTLDFIKRHPTNSPLGREFAARTVKPIVITQRNVHRGLRFSDKSGG